MRINISSNTIKISKSKQITGIISIAIEDFYFPEKNWNDVVVIILKLWIDSYHKIIINNSIEEKFVFMDGPFYFLSKIKQHEIEIAFHVDKTKARTFIVQKKQFNDALVAATREVLKKCNSEHWNTNEITDLKNTFEKFCTSEKIESNLL